MNKLIQLGQKSRICHLGVGATQIEENEGYNGKREWVTWKNSYISIASDWDQPTDKGTDKSNLGMDLCLLSLSKIRWSKRAVRCRGGATCLDLGGGYRDHANLRWGIDWRIGRETKG